MIKLPKHSCGDSRLSCVECSEIVCPKCMVECPVGNRCKKCAAKTESHVLKVTPWVAVRTLASAALAAYIFSYVSMFLFGGYWGWIITYAVGLFIGNLIHKVSGFKLGPVIIGTVLVGMIVGTALNPDTYNAFLPNNKISEQLALEDPDLVTPDAAMEKSKQMAKNASSSSNNNNNNNNNNNLEQQEPGSAPPSAQKMAYLQNAYRQMQVMNLVKLAIFVLGVLTPFTGAAPQLSFFPFRR